MGLGVSLILIAIDSCAWHGSIHLFPATGFNLNTISYIRLSDRGFLGALL